MSLERKMQRAKPKTLYAHKQVAATARGMAEELFELVMSQNELYREFKDECASSGLPPAAIRAKFVEMMIPRLLEPARATMAAMLRDPAHAALHESISDALIKDWPLHVGRTKDQRRARLTVNEDGSVKETRH
jgi:hypothetical protein